MTEKRFSLKTYFLAGLLALLPLLITAFVLKVLWGFLHNMLSPVMEALMALALGESLTATLSRFQVPVLLGLALTVLAIFAAGFLVQRFAGRALLSGMDVLFAHIPVANFIYNGVRKVTSAFDPQGGVAFKQVVLVRQPHGGPQVLGFLTKSLPKSRRHPKGLALVFVPTNNLYIGTLVAADPKDLEPLDMSVEQGMQLVVSAGLVLPQAGAKAGEGEKA